MRVAGSPAASSRIAAIASSSARMIV